MKVVMAQYAGEPDAHNGVLLVKVAYDPDSSTEKQRLIEIASAIQNLLTKFNVKINFGDDPLQIGNNKPLMERQILIFINLSEQRENIHNPLLDLVNSLPEPHNVYPLPGRRANRPERRLERQNAFIAAPGDEAPLGN